MHYKLSNQTKRCSLMRMGKNRTKIRNFEVLFSTS